MATGGASRGGNAAGGAEEKSGDVDCIKLGCYNGGTCVTTSEGSRVSKLLVAAPFFKLVVGQPRVAIDRHPTQLSLSLQRGLFVRCVAPKKNQVGYTIFNPIDSLIGHAAHPRCGCVHPGCS